MLSVRSSIIDDTQIQKIVARGNDLCIIEYNNGEYQSQRIPNPGIGEGNGLDLWPTQIQINEALIMGIIPLIIWINKKQKELDA